MMRSQCGFTLIELSVVLAILLLLAGLITPSLRAVERTGETRAFQSAMRRVATEAKQASVNAGRAATLRFEDTDGRFVVELAAEDTASEATSLTQIDLPEGTTIAEFRKGDAIASASDWQVQFYPDGTCESSVLTFDEGGKSSHWTLEGSTCSVKLEDGPAPTAEPDSWPAGEYEQRL